MPRTFLLVFLAPSSSRRNHFIPLHPNCIIPIPYRRRRRHLHLRVSSSFIIIYFFSFKLFSWGDKVSAPFVIAPFVSISVSWSYAPPLSLLMSPFFFVRHFMHDTRLSFIPISFFTLYFCFLYYTLPHIYDIIGSAPTTDHPCDRRLSSLLYVSSQTVDWRSVRCSCFLFSFSCSPSGFSFHKRIVCNANPLACQITSYCDILAPLTFADVTKSTIW